MANVLTFTEVTSLVEYVSDMSKVRLMLKLMLGALIVASLAFGLGCAGGTEVKVGQLVIGTITDSDDDDGEWKSQTFSIDVAEGVMYSFELSTSTDDTVGIWTKDANGYIVEVNIVVNNRAKSFIF